MARTYIGALRGSMSMDTAEWQRNFKRAEGSVKDFSKSFEQKAKRIDKQARNLQKFRRSMMRNFTLPLLGAGAAVVGLADRTAKYAVEVDNMAKSTRFAHDTTQEWMFVTDQLNTSMSAVESTAHSFTRRISQIRTGTGDAANAFNSLGLELYDNNGQLRASEDLYFDVIRSLSDVENETQRNIYAMALLGRQAAQMNNVLDASSDDIDRLRKRSHELGLVMSTENIEAGKEFADMTGELKMQFAGLTREIGMEFIPILKMDLIPYVQSEVIPAMREKVQQMRNMIEAYQELPDGMKTTIKTLVGLLAVAAPVAFVGEKFLKMLSGIIRVAPKVAGGVALIKSPFTLLAGALAGVTWGTIKWSEAAREGEKQTDRWGAETEDFNSIMEGFGHTLDQNTGKWEFANDVMEDYEKNLENVNEKQEKIIKSVRSMTAANISLLETQIRVNKQLAETGMQAGEMPHALGKTWEQMDNMIERYKNMETAAMRFGETMFYSSVVAGRGVEQLGQDIMRTARQVITAKMYEAIAHQLAAMFATLGPFAFAAASAGAAGVTALFNSLIPTSFAQEGIAFGPTLAMIGDRPGSKGEVVMGLERYEAMLTANQSINVHISSVLEGEDIRMSQIRTDRRKQKAM